MMKRCKDCPATKICSKCKVEKSRSEFSKDCMAKDKLQSRCKSCCAEYRQTHKVRAAEYDRAYCATINGHLRHTFACMKRRCENPKDNRYRRYGGRGIKVCFKNADEFVHYVVDDLQEDPRELQIDRIDNDRGYEPGNIRFVTCKVNCNNRRNSKIKN